jgi:diguanylate cyclase (GGDEF)-like protein
MEVGARNLQNLVRDNPFQVVHAQELEKASEQLLQALEDPASSKSGNEREVLECQSVIELLRDREGDLRQQRSVESQKSTSRNLIVGVIFVAFSLAVIIVLFAFLIRDAMRRRRSEQELGRTNHELASTVEELRQRADEANLRKAARDELQLCTTTIEAQLCTARHLQGLIEGSSGAFMMSNNSRNALEITASWNDPAPLADGIGLESCCGLRIGRPRWHRRGESEINCLHFSGAPPDSYICIPLAAQGETQGFVYMTFPSTEIAEMAAMRMPVAYAMVEVASLAIAGLELRAKLEAQSIRDSLTGLFNRRFMEVALERELHRAARRGASLAVLMLDVDHFKLVNDKFGHEAGDTVLREVANCFLECVRLEDIVCRFGGEEFVVILPEISEKLATERAEKIRRAVANLKTQFKQHSLSRISVSVGLAMYPDPATTADELLQMADKALYDAKHSGRNQLQIAIQSAPLLVADISA